MWFSCLTRSLCFVPLRLVKKKQVWVFHSRNWWSHWILSPFDVPYLPCFWSYSCLSQVAHFSGAYKISSDVDRIVSNPDSRVTNLSGGLCALALLQTLTSFTFPCVACVDNDACFINSLLMKTPVIKHNLVVIRCTHNWVNVLVIYGKILEGVIGLLPCPNEWIA